MLTDEIKGKGVDAAGAMRSQDVLDMLGIEISPARMKCAMLSLETLQGALHAAPEPVATGADAGPSNA